MKRVLIGIQARSTSKRLPGKVNMKISGKPMVDKVISAAMRTAAFVEDRSANQANVALLVPTGDKLNDRAFPVQVINGPEEDVLSRYMVAAKHYQPDYICRITSDCPLIPSPLIGKHIFTAMNYNLDYMSNVFNQCRTYPNGWDCEVISTRLLDWLDDNADKMTYREHVTSLLQVNRPDWCRVGHCVGHGDMSLLKISVDDMDDYNFTVLYDELMQSKLTYAHNTGEIVVRF